MSVQLNAWVDFWKFDQLTHSPHVCHHPLYDAAGQCLVQVRAGQMPNRPLMPYKPPCSARFS